MTERHIVPLIINLGKQRKRALQALEQGQGRLMDEVELALEDLRGGFGEDAAGKQLVPIVIIYKRKRKKPRGLLG